MSNGNDGDGGRLTELVSGDPLALVNEGTRNDTIMLLCDGCGTHEGAVHRYPICATHIHGFCDDGVGKNKFG